MYLQWLLMAKARQETCTPIFAKEFKCKCPTLSPAQKLAVQTRRRRSVSYVDASLWSPAEGVPSQGPLGPAGHGSC